MVRLSTSGLRRSGGFPQVRETVGRHLSEGIWQREYPSISRGGDPRCGTARRGCCSRSERGFRQRNGGTSLAAGPLPGDFDFKRLLKECSDSPGMLGPMHVWAAKDPDAAWAAMAEMDTGDGKASSKNFCT